MNAADIKRRGIHADERVSVVSEVGRLEGIRVAAYNIAEGCVAMYYPEANVLVERRVDPKSGTPSFKNVHVRVVR